MPARTFFCQVRRSIRSFVQLLSLVSQFHQIFTSSTMVLSAQLLLDYFHLAGLFMSVDNPSNWTLLEFHSTISLIWPFSCTITRLPYIYHNLNRLLYVYQISNIYRFFISYSLFSLLLSYYIILILPDFLYLLD